MQVADDERDREKQGETEEEGEVKVEKMPTQAALYFRFQDDTKAVSKWSALFTHAIVEAQEQRTKESPDLLVRDSGAWSSSQHTFEPVHLFTLKPGTGCNRITAKLELVHSTHHGHQQSGQELGLLLDLNEL